MSGKRRVDDGHGPAYGCNYVSCESEAGSPCPFTKDMSKQPAESETCPASSNNGRHQWAQHWTFIHIGMVRPNGYFCVWCLKHVGDEVS